jgi:hypothetical protein
MNAYYSPHFIYTLSHPPFNGPVLSLFFPLRTHSLLSSYPPTHRPNPDYLLLNIIEKEKMQTGMREPGTAGGLGKGFQRRFAVEFASNIEALKKKTSHSKKTLRAMFTFLTERIATEQAYATRLANLAKSGRRNVRFV